MLKFPRKNEINIAILLSISAIISGCAIPKEDTKETAYQYHPGAQIYQGQIIQIQTVFANDYQKTIRKNNAISNTEQNFYHKKYNINNEPPHIFINTSIIDSELENELLEQQKILKAPENIEYDSSNDEQDINSQNKTSETSKNNELYKYFHQKEIQKAQDKSLLLPNTNFKPNKYDPPIIEAEETAKVTHIFIPSNIQKSNYSLFPIKQYNYYLETNLSNDFFPYEHHFKQHQQSEQQIMYRHAHAHHKYHKNYILNEINKDNSFNAKQDWQQNCSLMHNKVHRLHERQNNDKNFQKSKDNSAIFLILSKDEIHNPQVLLQNEQQYQSLLNTKFSLTNENQKKIESKFTKNASPEERSKFMLKITVKLKNGKIMNFIEPTDSSFKLMETVRIVSQDNNQWLLVR